MKKIIAFFFLLFVFAHKTVFAIWSLTSGQVEQITRSNLSPLMERYILDELKDIRNNFERVKADLKQSFADKELEVAWQAMNYSANTTTYFFYIITSVGLLFSIIWRSSMKDLKASAKLVADKEVNQLAKKYEERLTEIERDLKLKTETILDNQKEIEKTQKISYLRRQADNERDNLTKLQLYNQIISIDPQSWDSYLKKAKVNLQLWNFQEAQLDANNAISILWETSAWYYYRAAAEVQLWNKAQALEDIRKAVYISVDMKDYINKNQFFDEIRDDEEFKAILT